MKRTLRALLLAAGLGTRLRPITNHIPKCLVPIGGEPLLLHWLKKLESIGCEEVLINTHYLSDQVERLIKGWNSSKLIIHTTFESDLLGTAGTLLENQNFFKDSTGLLIHADNMMQESLEGLIKAHNERSLKCIMTMLTFETNKPNSCGIVELDNQNRLIRFHEKVQNPPSNIANGAIYAFNNELIDHLNSMAQKPSDFSQEVIPSLIGRIQTWHTKQEYLDIGTPEALKKAQAIWPNKDEASN